MSTERAEGEPREAWEIQAGWTIECTWIASGKPTGAEVCRVLTVSMRDGGGVSAKVQRPDGRHRTIDFDQGETVFVHSTARRTNRT